MDRAHHRLCGFVHRGAGRSGMVHELGETKGIHAIRHLPDYRRYRGAGLGDERVRMKLGARPCIRVR